jgi:hypothetical protein
LPDGQRIPALLVKEIAEEVRNQLDGRRFRLSEQYEQMPGSAPSSRRMFERIFWQRTAARAPGA